MHEETQPAAIELLVAETAGEADTATATAAERLTQDPRVDDLERRIRELEAAISDLRTAAAAQKERTVAAAARDERILGRKAQTAHTPRLLAKGAEPAQAGNVDAALHTLSIEQRIAVKAGLLRAGLL